MKPQRIVVGLSGGVDSAVTAWLLKRAGHEVVGLFMQNWEGDDDDEYCSSRQDFLDAASVADVIGIELEHVNFSADYRILVFAEFLREYRAGRTPNPDVLCNAEIKFKAFLDHAVRLGADKIATGHYARVRAAQAQRPPGRPEGVAAPSGSSEQGERRGVTLELLKGLDGNKDQSYFLHRLTQAQLAKSMFPLGELKKTEVRRIAAEIGLPNAAKKDSTGICFIGERPFREFLHRWLAHTPGPIRDNDSGRMVGKHVGLSFYTIGQRKGLGIGGVKAVASGGARQSVAAGDEGGAQHSPWFVSGKDLADNVLEVVQGHDHPRLLSSTLSASNASWIGGPPSIGQRLAAKTRYRQADAACTVEAANEERFLALRFDSSQWAVAPGQSAVLYDGDVCLGGAVIDAGDAATGASGQSAAVLPVAASVRTG